MKGWNRKHLLMIVLMGLVLTGCSRNTINQQIAESIGTTGMYENGEPVETPEMKEARQQQEAAESEEAILQNQLDEAAAIAAGYFYDEAIEYLEGIETTESNSPMISAAITEYQNQKDSLTAYEGDIPHLCFPCLIYDTKRAFDGDTMSSTYSGSMITVKEFKTILETLYANGYVLINISDIAEDVRDESGVTRMTRKTLMLPPGKKPVIISQDDVNYASVHNGDGIATKLALDNGVIKAVYTDEAGHDLKGDYDLIPIVDSFIAEHPDFSYRGAKGIISVSGSNGVFGYDTTTSTLNADEEKRATVKEIAEVLVKSGWKIASCGYKHQYMNEMDLEALTDDITQWMDEVGVLVGDVSILFYPYGGEVEYPSSELTYLLDNGFEYLCGLWGESDFLRIEDSYVRQTRRFIDGYALQNSSGEFESFFRVGDVLDPER